MGGLKGFNNSFVTKLRKEQAARALLSWFQSTSALCSPIWIAYATSTLILKLKALGGRVAMNF